MGGFFTTFELSEARRDMAQTLGPMTLRIIRQVASESETGGPDLAESALVDGGGEPLEVAYRARLLRTPRTTTKGEESVVVADWEIKLPAEYMELVKRGDRLSAGSDQYTVHVVDKRPDALLCRLEVLKIESER